MDFVDLWRCGRIRCLHLIQVLCFRVLGSSFSRFRGLRFRSRVLRFRVLGASFSRYGCLVLRSSFSTASFSKLPIRCTYRTVDHHTVHIPHNVRTQATHSTTRCTYHTVHLPHNAPTTSRTCCI